MKNGTIARFYNGVTVANATEPKDTLIDGENWLVSGGFEFDYYYIGGILKRYTNENEDALPLSQFWNGDFWQV